jgi:hypothetical protein
MATQMRWVVLGGALAVLTTAAGCGGGTLTVVAGGGGSTGSLDGYVTDVDADAGTVVLSAVSDRSPVLWRADGSGDVATTDLGGVGYPLGVVIAPDHTSYVLGDSGEIWHVQDSQVDMVVGDAPVGQQPDDVADPDVGNVDSDGVYHEAGRVSAMTVDDEGQLVWTAVLHVATDPAQPQRTESLIVVRRMDGSHVELVAGSEQAPAMADAAVYAQQQDPGSGTPAVGFPMLVPGPSLDLAADDSGTYLLAAGYVLMVDQQGDLSQVLGGQGRDVPSEPFASEGSALDHGFTTDPDHVTASSGTVGVLDTSLAGESADGDAFDWSGDFTDGQQQVVDQVLAPEQGGGAADFGNVVVLARDGEASTAVAHVNALALDGDTLYVVGQAGELGDVDSEQAILLQLTIPSD